MATAPGQGATPARHTDDTRNHRNTRLTDETKPAFKTTEFIVYIATVLGILIAGALIKGSEDGTDEFMSPQVWTLITVAGVGYMLSRGIAKSGSRHRYDDDDRH